MDNTLSCAYVYNLFKLLHSHLYAKSFSKTYSNYEAKELLVVEADYCNQIKYLLHVIMV